MMDVDGCFEQRRQQYEDILREAEQYHFAREFGVTETSLLHSVAVGLRAWLSHVTTMSRGNSQHARKSGEQLIR